MNKVYTVHAYRWGQRERHSYLVGVYSTITLAMRIARQEEEDRGGKYECEVIEWTVDETPDVMDQVVIKALPEQHPIVGYLVKTAESDKIHHIEN